MKHLDPSILTAGIPVPAMRAEPMTTAEIDAHPDSARIWATVECLRGLRQEGYDEGYADAEEEFAPEGGGETYEDAISDVDARIADFLNDHKDDISSALRREIESLTAGL